MRAPYSTHCSPASAAAPGCVCMIIHTVARADLAVCAHSDACTWSRPCACFQPGRARVRAAYARGIDGDNECPTRYYRIMNKEACWSAAEAMGEYYYGTDSASYYPSGCFYSERRGVYLNTHPTGSGSSGAQPLCSGATLLARPAYSAAAWGTQGVLLRTQRCAQRHS